MLVDEFSRLPNFYRLSAFPSSGTELSDLICGCHLYHPASSDFKRAGPARPPLSFARLILARLENQTFCFEQFLQRKSQSTQSAKLIVALKTSCKEASMEYLISVAVVSMMALYALIIVGCLKQPEW
jgi:hypothetical protein